MVYFTVNETVQTPDGIGGTVEKSSVVYRGTGILDMLSGSNQNNYQNALVEQSTHILIAAYFDGYANIIKHNNTVDSNGKRYRITYVDNPVGLNHCLEIYLNNEIGGAYGTRV